MAFGSNNPKVVVEVHGDATGYQASLQNALDQTAGLGQKFKQIGSNLGQIGRTMTAAFTVPIIGAAVAVGAEFNKLDTNMRNIQSITGLSEEAFEDLQNRLITLSKDQTKTTESAASLADGYYFVKSAIDDADLAFAALEISTKAATAGLTDTKTASNAIIGAFNAYGGATGNLTKDTERLSYISDVLFKTVDRGVITFDELADGLGRLTNSAAIANIPIEDIGAAMVVLTRKGMPAAEAFTALNQVISKLAAPTQKIIESAKDLGVDISIAAIKTKGLAGVLEDIYKADPTGEGFFALFGNNVRALKGSAALAATGTGLLREEIEKMRDASGRTSAAFEQQTKSLSAQMAFLKNDLMAVGMTLLQIVLPYFTIFVGWLQKATDWLSKLDPTTQKWVLGLLALLAVAGPLLMILGSLATAIGAIMTIVGVISAPIWVVIAAIVALIAVLGLLYIAWKNNWFGMRDHVTQVVTYLKNLWASFLNWFHMLTTGQLGTLSTLWRNTWESVKLIFNGAITNLKLLWQAWQYARQGDWYNFGATLRQIWDNNWNIMVQVLRNAWSNLSAIFTSSVNNIRNWWSHIDWSSLGKDIGRGIINGLNNMGSALYNAIRRVAQNMLYAFQGFWGINSPSTLMEDQFKFLAQGAILGWDNNFTFSPQAINNQMMSMYSAPQTAYTGESNSRVISLLEQLNNRDERIDEGVLVRAFRDAVLLLRD